MGISGHFRSSGSLGCPADTLLISAVCLFRLIEIFNCTLFCPNDPRWYRGYWLLFCHYDFIFAALLGITQTCYQVYSRTRYLAAPGRTTAQRRKMTQAKVRTRMMTQQACNSMCPQLLCEPCSGPVLKAPPGGITLFDMGACSSAIFLQAKTKMIP